VNEPVPGGSVTRWLVKLKGGSPAAVQPLWDEYFARLVALARARLRSLPRAAADEEDVALSAFDSFCRGVGAGRFPRLDDRDDLWQVLFVITTRKAVGLARHETRDKRGGGRAESLTGSDAAHAGPTPEEAAEVADECTRLLGLLGASNDLRRVAVWKLEGYTNSEIAALLDRSVSAVERKPEFDSLDLGAGGRFVTWIPCPHRRRGATTAGPRRSR